jgi:hypothetical protein
MNIRISKRVLADCPMPYAVASYEENGTAKALFASEMQDGPCLLIDREKLVSETIWSEPGGTMNVVPDPNENGFWAIQKFFPVFKSEKSEIVFVSRNKDGHWTSVVRASLPYVHRIALVDIGGKRHILACTLCSEKAFTEDWSNPGAVYISRIPEDHSIPLTFQPILENIPKNHGLSVSTVNGHVRVLVAGGNGVHEILFNGKGTIGRETRRLTDREASEAILYDLDGDETEELITIEGFHGNSLFIYKSSISGWQELLSYDISFGHVLWTGKIAGENAIIISDRGANKDLYILTFSNPDMKPQKFPIDAGVGATQIEAINGKEIVILATAHALGKCMEYTLEGISRHG